MVEPPAGPSRSRAAVRREPRGSGALPLGQGGWAVPALPGFPDSTARAITPGGQAEGRAVRPNSSACGARDAARLPALSPAAREDHAERVPAAPHRIPERKR
ncbi:Chromate resistance protein ChrB [Streptomyces hygroscopicus]|uniref:Chromate resistance protein ChrB n=1 Tax=Streptomyces hygroscopicus TaxID=1912 RepID=UPI00362A78DA